MDTTATGFKTPYMSFQTLWAFLAELGTKPLPPQLDRSMMTTKSGTDQNNIMSALEEFGFVDGVGAVQPDLQAFVDADEDGRKAILKTLVELLYEPALKVSAENGTHQNLKDCFRDSFNVSGETQRKAITFFLHAAQTAGISLSSYFPKTRAGSGAPGATKARKTTTRKKIDKPGETNGAPNGSGSQGNQGGHSQTVELESGGTVTLIYDVNMFEVTDDDEAFVLGLIKKLRTYKADHQTPDQSDSEDGAS